MNNIDECLKKPLQEKRFEFGLSPLHCWIRFFMYLIHVSYRLGIKKWQARTPEDKQSVAQRKKYIQDQFRMKLGLIIDKPRPGGCGTSDDGNTSRTFFKNSAVSAEITGIDKELIDRCRTILECLGSSHKIKTTKFKEFSLITARKLVEAYPWYFLPPSVHKVLIHGDIVIDNALASIGELSEEAAEANNKNIKHFRLNHTRKISRVATNTDLLYRLLLNSDPFITSLRKLPKKKKKEEHSKEVLDLLDV